jgi:DNA (cytosine-5)-methyltransferase 1
MSRSRTPRVITFADLFCGAGGLSLGFKWASTAEVVLRPSIGVEIEPAYAASYASNFNCPVFVGPIEEFDDTLGVHIIIGGPPCQGFSPLSRIYPHDHHFAMNSLWRHFFRHVEVAHPLGFVIENVPNFFRSHEFQCALEEAHRLGYKTTYGVLNAAHFGVSQLRRRGFFLGSRVHQPRLPEATHVREEQTVYKAIGDLTDVPVSFGSLRRLDDEGDFIPHAVRDLNLTARPSPLYVERYKHIPPGGDHRTLLKARPDLCTHNFRKLAALNKSIEGRLRWDEPAYTIHSRFYRTETGRFIHPEHHRAITFREAARLQGFPDDFKFCGSRREIARQIGNAVPPPLARAVARALLSAIMEI